MTHKTSNWKRKLIRFKHKLLSFIYPLWAVIASKKRMDRLNEASLRSASLGNKEITIILHGIFTNYYSAVYWAVRWFKRFDINVVSIGYDYRRDLRSSASTIKKQIDAIMSEYKIERVNMIGISLGGQVARTYIESFGGNQVVTKLVTVFSPLTAPREKDFSVAKIMDQLAGNKEITKRSLEQTIAMEKSFTVQHLALYGTSDWIVGKLSQPVVEAERVTMVAVPGGHTLVSYNVEAMEYARLFLVGGKEAVEASLQ